MNMFLHRYVYRTFYSCPLYLTGEDARVSPDQSRPSIPLVEQLLASASGPLLSNRTGDSSVTPTLTVSDLARLTSKRRAEAKKQNGQFSLSTSHKMFGSSKCVITLSTISVLI